MQRKRFPMRHAAALTAFLFCFASSGITASESEKEARNASSVSEKTSGDASSVDASAASATAPNGTGTAESGARSLETQPGLFLELREEAEASLPAREANLRADLKIQADTPQELRRREEQVRDRLRSFFEGERAARCKYKLTLLSLEQEAPKALPPETSPSVSESAATSTGEPTETAADASGTAFAAPFTARYILRIELSELGDVLPVQELLSSLPLEHQSETQYLPAADEQRKVRDELLLELRRKATRRALAVAQEVYGKISPDELKLLEWHPSGSSSPSFAYESTSDSGKGDLTKGIDAMPVEARGEEQMQASFRFFFPSPAAQAQEQGSASSDRPENVSFPVFALRSVPEFPLLVRLRLRAFSSSDYQETHQDLLRRRDPLLRELNTRLDGKYDLLSQNFFPREIRDPHSGEENRLVFAEDFEVRLRLHSVRDFEVLRDLLFACGASFSYQVDRNGKTEDALYETEKSAVRESRDRLCREVPTLDLKNATLNYCQNGLDCFFASDAEDSLFGQSSLSPEDQNKNSDIAPELIASVRGELSLTHENLLR